MEAKTEKYWYHLPATFQTKIRGRLLRRMPYIFMFCWTQERNQNSRSSLEKNSSSGWDFRPNKWKFVLIKTYTKMLYKYVTTLTSSNLRTEFVAGVWEIRHGLRSWYRQWSCGSVGSRGALWAREIDTKVREADWKEKRKQLLERLLGFKNPY